MATEWKVGQKLWFASSVGYRESHEVEVTKVGRKWIYLDDGFRFNPETGLIDGAGYTPSGRVWRSREEAEVERQRQAEWSHLLRFLSDRYQVPAHLMLEDIRQIASMVGQPRGEKQS